MTTAPSLDGIEQNKKCCGKCAMRRRSIERADGYGFVRIVEGWEAGALFYCHESIPGHPGEIADDRPRWRLCAGFLALRTAPTSAQVRHLEEATIVEAMMGYGPAYVAAFLEREQSAKAGEAIDKIAFPPDVPTHVGMPWDGDPR